jgi:hypothetical protein
MNIDCAIDCLVNLEYDEMGDSFRSLVCHYTRLCEECLSANKPQMVPYFVV